MATGHRSRFSYPDDARLVECVRSCPLLFNHEKFVETKNTKDLREAWRLVAAAVGRDEDSCKKRWRDIRDHYFKIKRKNLRRGAPAETKWPLFEMLSFLDNAKRKRCALTYIGSQMTRGEDLEYSDPDNSVDIYEPETTVKVEAESSEMEFVGVPPPPPPPENFNFQLAPQTDDFHEDLGLRESFERRLAVLEARMSEESDDDVDMFMKSIAHTLKKFAPNVRAEAKLKILSVVTQLEFPR